MIARLHEHEIEFTDGSRIAADMVVDCTGYKISFPFFDEGFISAPDNHIELFRRVFAPDVENLAIIGLLQPLGAIVLADICRDQEAMRRRFVSSKRHTIQVDFDDYLHDLAKERRAGAGRARAGGFALPRAA